MFYNHLTTLKCSGTWSKCTLVDNFSLYIEIQMLCNSSNREVHYDSSEAIEIV